MKTFTLAIYLRMVPVALWGIGYAPDSRLFLSLSEQLDFTRGVGYPLVLSVLGVPGTITLQILCDSLTAALVGTISPLGGILYALSLGPIVYSNYVLTDTLATFFLACCLVFRNKYLFGVSLLCAIFTREICLLLSPLFICLWWSGCLSSTPKWEFSE